MYIIFFNLLFKVKCCPQLTFADFVTGSGQIPESFWVLAWESSLMTSCLAPPQRYLPISFSRSVHHRSKSASLSLLKHLPGTLVFTVFSGFSPVICIRSIKNDYIPFDHVILLQVFIPRKQCYCCC